MNNVLKPSIKPIPKPFIRLIKSIGSTTKPIKLVAV